MVLMLQMPTGTPAHRERRRCCSCTQGRRNQRDPRKRDLRHVDLAIRHALESDADAARFIAGDGAGVTLFHESERSRGVNEKNKIWLRTSFVVQIHANGRGVRGVEQDLHTMPKKGKKGKGLEFADPSRCVDVFGVAPGAALITPSGWGECARQYGRAMGTCRAEGGGSSTLH